MHQLCTKRKKLLEPISSCGAELLTDRQILQDFQQIDSPKSESNLSHESYKGKSFLSTVEFMRS